MMKTMKKKKIMKERMIKVNQKKFSIRIKIKQKKKIIRSAIKHVQKKMKMKMKIT